MNSPPKNKPETAPERTPFAPELDPIADVVESDHLFVGMVSLADNAEFLHVEAGSGQLFHGCFRCGVVCEDGNDCVSCFHLILLESVTRPGSDAVK